MELVIILILGCVASLAIEIILPRLGMPHESELNLPARDCAAPVTAGLSAAEAAFAVAPISLGGAAVAVAFATPGGAALLAALAAGLYFLGRRRLARPGRKERD